MFFNFPSLSPDIRSRSEQSLCSSRTACRLPDLKFLPFFPCNALFFSCKVTFIRTTPSIYSLLISRSHIILQISPAFQGCEVQAPETANRICLSGTLCVLSWTGSPTSTAMFSSCLPRQDFWSCLFSSHTTTSFQKGHLSQLSFGGAHLISFLTWL